MHLHERCITNDIDSIVEFHRTNEPHIRGRVHIDMHSVMDKNIIKQTIYKPGWINLSLNHVCRIILKEGKYKGQTGDNFNYMPLEEKRKYVLQDAELVMKLSKHDNFKILDMMLAISQLCELEFEYVCRTNPSSWWKHVYQRMQENGQCGERTKDYRKRECWGYENESEDFDINIEEEQIDLSPVGGKVIEPKKGL